MTESGAFFGEWYYAHSCSSPARFLNPWAVLYQKTEQSVVDSVFNYERGNARLLIGNHDLRKKSYELETEFHSGGTTTLQAEIEQARSESAARRAENLALKPSTRWRIIRPLCSLKNILLSHKKKEQ